MIIKVIILKIYLLLYSRILIFVEIMSVIPDIKIYLYLILIFPFPFSHYINRGRRLVLYARRSIVSSAGEI